MEESVPDPTCADRVDVRRIPCPLDRPPENGDGLVTLVWVKGVDGDVRPNEADNGADTVGVTYDVEPVPIIRTTKLALDMINALFI